MGLEMRLVSVLCSGKKVLMHGNIRRPFSRRSTHDEKERFRAGLAGSFPGLEESCAVAGLRRADESQRLQPTGQARIGAMAGMANNGQGLDSWWPGVVLTRYRGAGGGASADGAPGSLLVGRRPASRRAF